MANHIKFIMSAEVIDEYTQNISFADQDGDADTSQSNTLYRYHPTIGKSLGGGTSNINQLEGSFSTIEGFTSGKPVYLTAPVSGGNPVLLGTENRQYDLLFIKYTGYQPDAGGDTSKLGALGTATNGPNSVTVFIEHSDIGWTPVSRLQPGMSFISSGITPPENCGWWVKSDSTSETKAVEFCAVKLT